MFDHTKLEQIEKRYLEIQGLISSPDIVRGNLVDLLKEYHSIQPVNDLYVQYKQILSQVDELQNIHSDDADMIDMIREELDNLLIESNDILNRIQKLIDTDIDKSSDCRNVIAEIRAGEGGEEAGIFASELLRMYTRYAAQHGWFVEILFISEINRKSIREVILSIHGENVFKQLRYESGVHRVQRVSVTDSRKRMHTSTVSVAILPEMTEADVNLNMNDVRIEICKSSGPGGQGVNTSDTAVKMTHIPTGIYVDMQAERSQLQNKIRAKEVLIARLYEYEQNKIKSEYDKSRKNLIGGNKRVEKIRTYNYPQNRVTDHRAECHFYDLYSILDGSLDEFVEMISTKLDAR